jgi:hypothetical protein
MTLLRREDVRPDERAGGVRRPNLLTLLLAGANRPPG